MNEVFFTFKSSPIDFVLPNLWAVISFRHFNYSIAVTSIILHIQENINL